jgi:hypothetical protein
MLILYQWKSGVCVVCIAFQAGGCGDEWLLLCLSHASIHVESWSEHFAVQMVNGEYEKRRLLLLLSIKLSLFWFFSFEFTKTSILQTLT